MKIVLTCKAPRRDKRSCAFKSKTVSVSRAAASLSLISHFKKRKLKPGTVITITVSAPAQIGRVFTFKMRARKQPSRTSNCVVPGAKPASCR